MRRAARVLSTVAVLLAPAARPAVPEPVPGSGAAPRPPVASAKPRGAAGVVVYRSALADGKTDGWSGDKPLALDKARKALGPLHNQTVRLKLPKLPKHRFLRLTLDLHVVGTWDGSVDDGDGPDTIAVALAGGRKLMHASFASIGSPQSYPDTGLWAGHAAGAGAAAHVATANGGTSRYRLDFTFPHADANAVVEFTGRLSESRKENRTATNESWAIGNVVVRALPAAPAKLHDKRFAELWAHLAGQDPLQAHRAAWTLVSAGEAAVPRIARAVDPSRDPAVRTRIASLIRRLDDDDWRIRQKATAELKALGAAARPALRRTLAGKPSAEVASRIEDILSAHKTPAAEIRRAGRARWVLQAIGGEKALAIRRSLPEPPPAKPTARIPPGGVIFRNNAHWAAPHD